MELAFNGYQLTLTVRIRQPKNKRSSEAPMTCRTAPNPYVRDHRLLTSIGTHIAPTR
jgi:hypothetical protein